MKKQNHSDKLSSAIEDGLKERRKKYGEIPLPLKPFNPDDYSGLEQGQHSLMLEKK